MGERVTLTGRTINARAVGLCIKPTLNIFVMSKKGRNKTSKKKPVSDSRLPHKEDKDVVVSATTGNVATSNAIITAKTIAENSPLVGSRPVRYPYPTDYNDHFETPSRAYFDLLPLLDYVLCDQRDQTKDSLMNSSKTESKEVVLYDPYFCTGRAAILLNEIFEQNHKESRPKIRIQHEKRDFYHDVRNNTIPHHDIFITNPPYSGDHKERCLNFCVEQLKASGRPFFLLMPNYVATKEYLRKSVSETGKGSKKIQLAYVIPSAKRPYEYDHPEGTGHETSPFASVWFCGMGYGSDEKSMQQVRDAFTAFHESHSHRESRSPEMATSLQELIRIGGVSGEKRKNPRQRKKMRQIALKRACNATIPSGNILRNGGDGKKDKNNKPNQGKENNASSKSKKRVFSQRSDGSSKKRRV